MQTKKQEPIKSCIRCRRGIKPKEDYIRVTEYINCKQNREQFFHISCYESLFEIKGMALNMVKRANKLMELAGLPQEEEVTV